MKRRATLVKFGAWVFTVIILSVPIVVVFSLVFLFVSRDRVVVCLEMAKNLDVNVEALPVELMWEVQAYLSTKDLKVLGAADSRWGAGCPYSADI